MSVALALGAAVVFGSADFLGGLVSRRVAPLAVALGSQLAGVAVLLVALPLLGPAPHTLADLAWGGLGGLFGALGVVALFSLLARGPMSVVATLAALAAAIVPIAAGIALGDRPGPLALLGIGTSLVAVVLITREATEPVDGEAPPRAGLRVAAGALGAGVLFGLFFVALHQTTPTSGLWPLLGARLASVPMLWILATRRGVAGGWRAPGAWRVVLVSGALDMGANILYLLAIRHGMLAIVAAIGGLYPVATVLLARQRLDERLQPVQLAGLATAAVAAVLIAI